MRTYLICAALGVAAPISVVWAQSADEAKPVVQAAAAKSDSSTPTGAIARSRDTLSVDFPDEEIRTVLRNVADLFELNLVIPDTLQGKTSIKLRDVTWRQIYKVVLEPVGYTFVEEGNIIKIVTAESLNLEPLTTEVFILNYAKAAEVKPSIDALVDSKLGGKIVVDARSNALVVTERPSAVQRVRPIIQSLDKPTEQVMIETKFIDVSNSDVKNIGVNWSSLQNYKVSMGPSTSKYDTSHTGSNSSTHTDTNIDVPYMQDGYARAGQLAGGSFGPAFTQKQYTRPDGTTGYANDYSPMGPASEAIGGFTNTITHGVSTVFTADQFGIILSALGTLGNTKLVSNPTVVTLNNTEATINIGDEYPIPNYTYNQERGNFEVSGFLYRTIGVILKVTPQVNNAGFIKLNIEPEVSTNDGQVNFGGASGAQIPIIGVKKTKTQVTLKDGYTLGLGGLISVSETKNENKVPLLGDIPGLGRLFKSNSKNLTKDNLVVFITARTLRPDGGTTGEVFDPREIRAMQLRKDELPGYRDGSDPFYQPPVETKSGK